MEKQLKELICKIETQDPITLQVVEKVCLDASTIHRCVSCGTYNSPYAWVYDRKSKLYYCMDCVIERK